MNRKHKIEVYIVALLFGIHIPSISHSEEYVVISQNTHGIELINLNQDKSNNSNLQQFQRVLISSWPELSGDDFVHFTKTDDVIDCVNRRIKFGLPSTFNIDERRIAVGVYPSPKWVSIDEEGAGIYEKFICNSSNRTNLRKFYSIRQAFIYHFNWLNDVIPWEIN